MSKPLKPLGMGEILDRTFQIYSRHFTQLMIIMIILMGPFILLQNVLLPGGETDLLPSYDFEFDSLEDMFEQVLNNLVMDNEGPAMDNEDPVEFALLVVFVFLALPLMLLVFYPWAVSSVTFSVESAITGKQRSVSDLLKGPLKRLAPLIGNTMLYYILLSAIFIGIVILFLILSTVITVFLYESSGVTASILAGIFLFVLFLCSMFLVIYLAVRWMFYMPFIVVDGKGLGIGSSWGLTKGYFWRVFGILLLMFIVYFVIVLAFTVVPHLVLQNTVLNTVVQIIITLLLYPLMFITYALIFFDLKARKEGTDLETMLNCQDPSGGNQGNNGPGQTLPPNQGYSGIDRSRTFTQEQHTENTERPYRSDEYGFADSPYHQSRDPHDRN